MVTENIIFLGSHSIMRKTGKLRIRERNIIRSAAGSIYLFSVTFSTSITDLFADKILLFGCRQSCLTQLTSSYLIHFPEVTFYCEAQGKGKA